MVVQSKYWMFTVNNPLVDPDPDATVKLFAKEVDYAVWQLEKGESGTPHFQGYLELAKRARMTGVCRLLGSVGLKGAHVEARKGSQEQAIAYCSKEDTRQAGPWTVGQKAVVTQGSRTDLLDLRNAVKQKRTFMDIMDDDSLAASLIKYHKAAGFMRAEYELATSPKWRNVEVIVLYGPTGTGKTRQAVEDGAWLWNPSSPEWWDGYRGEECVCIDEFYGQLPMARMLRLLDGHPCRLPVKGAFSWALWTKVYITSNTHPDNWYGEGSGVPDAAKAALKRRITRVVEVL